MRRPTALVTMVAVAIMGVLFLNPVAASASAARPAASAGSGAATPTFERDGAKLRTRAAALPGKTSFAQDSFFSGTLAPGGQQHWIWNNAGTDIAFRVGFSPAGASTSATCQFETVDQWYEGLRTGERKFHFVIQNVGSLSCGATIELSAIAATTTRSTGGLNPGESISLDESFIDQSSSYLVGVVPSGATTTGTCQLKVVQTSYQIWNVHDLTGPFLNYTVQNVGSIACVGTVQVGSVPTERVLSARNLAPGARVGWVWNNANPLTAVYLTGAIVSGDIGCEMEITRTWYSQDVNSNGTTERRLHLFLKNIGDITCSGQATLARI